ncbi:kinase-like domain-containing protein, partial [Rhodocollybia butyracea]
ALIVRPQQAPELSVSTFSDATILELWHSEHKIDQGTFFIHPLHRFNTGDVARIAYDAVAKSRCRVYASELVVSELVRTETRIPVPFCQRYIPSSNSGGDACIVMQYVEGDVLDDVWATLSIWMKFRVIITLRYYIRQLRMLPALLRLSNPGPIGGSPDYCESRLLTEDPPNLFESYADMVTWYGMRHRFMQKYRKMPQNIAHFDDSRPLAIVHQDLHPRNLIMGRDGQLWVIDWGRAGVYPDWFEYGNLMMLAEESRGSGQMPFIRAILYSLRHLLRDISDIDLT